MTDKGMRVSRVGDEILEIPLESDTTQREESRLQMRRYLVGLDFDSFRETPAAPKTLHAFAVHGVSRATEEASVALSAQLSGSMSPSRGRILFRQRLDSRTPDNGDRDMCDLQTDDTA